MLLHCFSITQLKKKVSTDKSSESTLLLVLAFGFFSPPFIGLKCLFKYKSKWQESRSLKVIREIWIYATNEICLLTIYQDMQNIEENSVISIFNIAGVKYIFFCKCRHMLIYCWAFVWQIQFPLIIFHLLVSLSHKHSCVFWSMLLRADVLQHVGSPSDLVWRDGEKLERTEEQSQNKCWFWLELQSFYPKLFTIVGIGDGSINRGVVNGQRDGFEPCYSSGIMNSSPVFGPKYLWYANSFVVCCYS